jgi:rubredoxin
MTVRYIYGVDALHDALVYECQECRYVQHDKKPHDEEPIRYNKGFNHND